ncbi:MAG: 3-methyl-2-oxobutanoate hydroxymethyltransferase [Rhodobacterales bacterium]|jgi:3-methyl-2-oxobutanoate hydroxymethyltransferase
MTLTITDLQKMYRAGEKLVMTSCYDASFATLCDEAGVEILLVGDSVGMVVQGRDSTLAVSLKDIVYHTECVARGSCKALIVGDLPFGTYQASPIQAFESATKLMAAGAHMVKAEGGEAMAETVKFLVDRGIPVMGHLGLTPQAVHQLGGFRVQGKTDEASERIIQEAKLLEKAGAAAIVLECIPSKLGKAITGAIDIPTIGIGGGPDCSGQILILHDMLDIYPGKKARFVKNYMESAGSVQAALANFVREVKDGTFPEPQHCFN